MSLVIQPEKRLNIMNYNIEIEHEINWQNVDGFPVELLIIRPRLKMSGGIYGTVTFPHYSAILSDEQDVRNQRQAAMLNAKKTLASFIKGFPSV